MVKSLPAKCLMHSHVAMSYHISENITESQNYILHTGNNVPKIKLPAKLILGTIVFRSIVVIL